MQSQFTGLVVVTLLGMLGCGGSTTDRMSGVDGGGDAATTKGAGGGANPASGGQAGSSGGSGGRMIGSGGAQSSGGTPSSGGSSGGGAGGASGHPSTDGGASDAGSSDASNVIPDGGCDDNANTDLVSWGSDGGLVASRDTSSLATPHTYTHSRDRFTNALPLMCQTEVAGCPSNLLADINAELASAAVTGALAAHTVYGVDNRASDGTVFRITMGNDYVDVGNPCGTGASGCVAIPPVVQALVDHLNALDAQELAKKACTDVFGTP